MISDVNLIPRECVRCNISGQILRVCGDGSTVSKLFVANYSLSCEYTPFSRSVITVYAQKLPSNKTEGCDE